MRHKNSLHPVQSIVSKIDRLIRPCKTIPIVVIASLIILSQLCSGCTNTSKSEYFMKIVGSCHQPTSIKIIDETGGSDPQPRSIRNSQNSPFKTYVNTISKHFFTKIDAMGQCQGNSIGNPEVELVFVYRPIISYGIAPFNFELTKFNDTRQLDSPWVKLTIGKSHKLIVRAAFIWNERQFLLDQAVLSDARNVPTNPPLPIDSRIFSKFIQDYNEAVFLAPEREAEAAFQARDALHKVSSRRKIDFPAIQLNIDKRLEAAKTEGKVNISKRLPADIIWLLRNTAIESDPPTPVRETIDKTIKQRAGTYINLIQALLDRRFSSLQTEQHYKSVLDLKDVLNIDTYQINQLH
jgi:hypothetical protein